jgi:HAE1 family hydrophobic/amphiphilic exporter-1
VVQALLFGGVLAFLVLFLFLRDPRYPVAIGLAIPISVMAAFALCYLADVSLNVMSLGGLALGVGMLVDNSIVVLENVFRHREEEGLDAATSASVGANEVAGAITASTLTTIAVFGPVLYVKGVAGALFTDLSLAVAFSLLASLLVALTLLPVMAARVDRKVDGEGERATEEAGDIEGWLPVRIARKIGRAIARFGRFIVDSVRITFADLFQGIGRLLAVMSRPLLGAFDRAFATFTVQYERSLEWALVHRGQVLVIAFGALALAVAAGQYLPRSLMPEVDEGAFRVELNLPVGTPLEVTAEAAGRLESALLETAGVEAVFSRVGRAREAELATRELTGLNNAALDVRLTEGRRRTTEVVDEFRTVVDASGIDPRAVSIETGRATSLGRAIGLGDADVAVKVRGQELDSLVKVADEVLLRIRDLPQIADARIDLQLTQPELEIEVNRAAAARYGLSVTQVADAIEAYLRGSETDRPYTEFSDKIDIRVRLPAAERQALADVMMLTLDGVPIRELVTAREGYGPVEIRRSEQNRTVQVLADVRGGGIASAVESIEAAVADVQLPALTALRVGGENEEMRESFRSLLFAFGLALFLVFLIMAAKFESLVQPIVVLVSVPLAAIGAVAALALARDGLNAMSGIGLVILIGIVVNDAIIKVDFINQKRAEGATKRHAILEAGRLRLRPIVMTTITTVFGLLPMALGWGAGADLRAPLAVAVIGGLISATFLTLIVVPVVYSLLVSPAESVRPVTSGGSGGRESRVSLSEATLGSPLTDS